MDEVRGAVGESLHALFSVGSFAGWTDRQLLERFQRGRDEVGERAFAALVERHGAGVLRVCRGVLGDSHDAEDAFQATFLVLARRAGTIRDRDAVGAWLMGVAFRVAGCARSAAIRRRTHERKAAVGITHAVRDDEPGDWRSLLHQEVGRLPEKFRTPLALCYLEGLTQEEVARRLGWPIGTVRSRVARGREWLRHRLVRRGVAPTVAATAVGSAWDAAAVTVPEALVQLTIRAAAGAAMGPAAMAGAVSSTVAGLAGEGLETMFWTQLKINAALLAAGLLVVGAGVVAAQSGALPGLAPATGAKVKADLQPQEATKPRLENDTLYVLDIDRAKAAALGLTAEEVIKQTLDAFKALKPSERRLVWIAPGGNRLYFVGLPDGDEELPAFDPLLNLWIELPVKEPRGARVKLRNMGTRMSRQELEGELKRRAADLEARKADLDRALAELEAARIALNTVPYRSESLRVRAGLGPPTSKVSPPNVLDPGPGPATVDREAWARKLAGLNDANWRTAFAVGGELAELPDDVSFPILKENWPKITNVAARQQLLKAWFFALPRPVRAGAHPRLLDGLDLGARDPSPQVQEWAFSYLTEVAIKNFSEDFPAYKAWFQANRDRPVDQVFADAVRNLAVEAAHAVKKDAAKLAEQLGRRARVLEEVPAARQAALDAGLVRTLGRWVSSADAGETEENLRLSIYSLNIIGSLKLGEADLRRLVVPSIGQGKRDEVRAAAMAALGGRENPWALELLLGELERSLESRDRRARASVGTTAAGIASFDDPRVIPILIGVIDADNTHDTITGVGHFALGKLTGVQYDASHDGAWWRKWWEKNKERYPEAVRTMAIPEFPKLGEAQERETKQAQADPLEDVADTPAQDLRIGGDAKKRYFLIGAKDARPPEAGYGLLIVLPGGDGSADFQPFIRRMHKNALNPGWLVAEAVAPKWDEAQFNKVVWPTATNRYPAAKFTTEDFIADIVADVKKRSKIDPRRVILLGWSSGGPACYATALRKDSPATGSFIAMSVFRPGQLPAVESARGKPFYLLQSPEDRVTTIQQAEAAEKALTAAGAKVRLRRYEGGHGWHGDIWKMIGEGIGWLEQQTAAP